MGELKAFKVSNPLYVGEIAKAVQDFTAKINIATITYETLYSYFCATAQFGKDVFEFWVVLDEANVPVAFAHWHVMGLPHRGAVFCDHLYSWNRMKEPAKILMDEFVKFGERHNCPIYEFVAVNELLYRLFRKAGGKRGLEFNKTEQIFSLGRRKENGR